MQLSLCLWVQRSGPLRVGGGGGLWSQGEAVALGCQLTGSAGRPVPKGPQACPWSAAPAPPGPRGAPPRGRVGHLCAARPHLVLPCCESPQRGRWPPQPPPGQGSAARAEANASSRNGHFGPWRPDPTGGWGQCPGVCLFIISTPNAGLKLMTLSSRVTQTSQTGSPPAIS